MSAVSPSDPFELREQRACLRQVLDAALDAVNGRRCVSHYLTAHPLQDPFYLVAIGKAAASMTEGVLDSADAHLQRGLLITKAGHLTARVENDARLDCRIAGHPQPDENSLAAGQGLLDFLAQTPEHSEILFLISGGTSALAEVLSPGITLQDWQRLNGWLLGSGWDIAAMNRARRAVSQIKGGGLLRFLAEREVRCLLISDVQGDDPAVIGSGLLFPGEAYAGDEPDSPDWLQALLAGKKVSPAPVRSPSYALVATLDDARQATAAAAERLGYTAYVHSEFVDGEAVVAGEKLAEALLRGPPGIHIWGGETTVVLPERPGRGGRNQTLALAAALRLQGSGEALLLAAGTDGSDGPGSDAGALVDGATVARGERAGWSATHCLAGADAGSFLQASGDLIRTGSTGTNVMDLYLGLLWKQAQPAQRRKKR